ncbi:MAG: CPBP family intramembrane metalloprotease [Maribacter sp.]|nr:CPBP family intramembrane metalloprotease [Maribacter sp.]
MKTINLTLLIVVVFCISWLGVLPSLLLAHGIEISPGFEKFEILMTLGPLIGALLFIGKIHGKAGIRNFFKRLLWFRAKPLVIAIIILLPILISLLSSVIGLSLSKTAWSDAFNPTSILTNGLMIFLMYLIINTEELVWRGIVFDRLLKKFNYIQACIILIPIWWLFHLPLFLYPGGHQAGYGLIEFTCIVFALTFILGWIYIKTSKSLFYVHIHHQLFNGFGQAFPIFPIFINGDKMPVWTFCVLLLITAGILIVNYQKQQPPFEISEDQAPQEEGY